MLTRHRGGELAAQEASDLDAHLRDCAACRLEYERLGAPSEPLRDAGARAALEPDAATLLAAIRRFAEAHPGRDVEVLKSRVAAEIEPYLGKKAAGLVLAPVSAGGENLLSAVEPVLALFLGAEAAAKLVDRIVDAAIMETR